MDDMAPRLLVADQPGKIVTEIIFPTSKKSAYVVEDPFPLVQVERLSLLHGANLPNPVDPEKSGPKETRSQVSIAGQAGTTASRDPRTYSYFPFIVLTCARDQTASWYVS